MSNSPFTQISEIAETEGLYAAEAFADSHGWDGQIVRAHPGHAVLQFTTNNGKTWELLPDGRISRI